MSSPRLYFVARLALLAALPVAALPVAALADVAPAPLFRDGAVLQRGKPVPVWGSADPGERVAVAFAGQTVSAVAGPDGRWSVSLAPLEASAVSRDLSIKGKNTVVVRDVLVGEVWLASGQSNMEWILDYAENGRAEAKAANDPLLRQFKAAKTSAADPQTTLDGAWTRATPESAGQFTAVGYYFGRALREKLRVPVAILNSSWGGTGIDPWIPAQAHLDTPELEKAFTRSQSAKRPTPEQVAAYEAEKTAWEKARDEAKKAKQPVSTPAPKAPANLPGPRTLAGLNNAMVAPLAPAALRGFLWYQGESNSAHSAAYPVRFAALITGLRKQFGQGDLPFYWVQLPNYEAGDATKPNLNWALLREAQSTALSLPATAQAVTIDVGEPKGLHPKNKKAVGERLALLALGRVYAAKDVVWSGPVFKSAVREGAGYRVSFAELASPLRAAPAGLTGFELAGADQVFHPAEAAIEGAEVVVRSAAVPAPVALRYAWRNAPVAGLFNAAGLPAAPFRTDKW